MRGSVIAPFSGFESVNDIAFYMFMGLQGLPHPIFLHTRLGFGFGKQMGLSEPLDLSVCIGRVRARFYRVT